ncbi:hypothetical protein IAR50_003995 [Cryptococcus sp. DSM 104548]
MSHSNLPANHPYFLFPSMRRNPDLSPHPPYLSPQSQPGDLQQDRALPQLPSPPPMLPDGTKSVAPRYSQPPYLSPPQTADASAERSLTVQVSNTCQGEGYPFPFYHSHPSTWEYPRHAVPGQAPMQPWSSPVSVGGTPGPSPLVENTSFAPTSSVQPSYQRWGYPVPEALLPFDYTQPSQNPVYAQTSSTTASTKRDVAKRESVASSPPDEELVTKGGCHPCAICAKRFTRPSALMTHMHTHTGEKPYVCPICLRDFSVQSNCRRHIRQTHEAKDARAKLEAEEAARRNGSLYPPGTLPLKLPQQAQPQPQTTSSTNNLASGPTPPSSASRVDLMSPIFPRNFTTTVYTSSPFAGVLCQDGTTTTPGYAQGKPATDPRSPSEKGKREQQPRDRRKRY